MSFPKPFLFVKAGCPWCAEAEAYLKKHQIEYDSVDVLRDPTQMAAMKEVSGQTKAPTMKWGNEILADFGETELDAFLRERGVVKG